MNRYVVTCVLALSLCGCESRNSASGDAAGSDRAAAAGDEQQHRIYTPDQLQWKPAASLPAGAQMAVLEGDPSQSGYFAMRLRFPDGYRIPPHWHPNHERVTVISGTLLLGHGERFDAAAARPLPAGSYSTMAPGMRHFGSAKGATELQLTTIGPWGINYVNPADDPRKAATGASR